MSKLFVLAQIARKRVAVDAAQVNAVIDLDDLVPVPGAAAHVLGVSALRSNSLTVIDTGLALGELAIENPVGARALVLEIDGHDYALLIEDVFDVVEAKGEVQPVPGNLSGNWQRIALGWVETGAEPALLLDPAILLRGNRQEAA